MSHPVSTLAALLRTGRDDITVRWLERIASRVALKKHLVFPSETLIDEVPLLIEGIAQHLEEEADEISTMTPVMMKARELGRLRFHQAINARQLLWEFELLGAIMLEYLDEKTTGLDQLPGTFVRRLHRALATVQRNTIEEYLALAEAHTSEREERLRSFSRALSHELRNEVGAVLGAARMLREKFVITDENERETFIAMVINNAEQMERLVANLLQLSAVDNDTRRHRHVLLRHSVEEVIRRLRHFADAKGIRIDVADDLPAIEVNSAVVDLALTNLVANAVKYSNPAQTEKKVRVQALVSSPAVVTIEVVDNGLGVSEEDRPFLFERFYRSPTHSGVEGSGLGLSIVRESVERIGGRVWADFPDTGETVFAFTVPARRAADLSG